MKTEHDPLYDTLLELDIKLREFYTANKSGLGGGYGLRLIEQYCQSRVSELERENKELREWLEAYKKSNAEFMKSTTDQKFEIERLEKEVETLRLQLSFKNTTLES